MKRSCVVFCTGAMLGLLVSATTGMVLWRTSTLHLHSHSSGTSTTMSHGKPPPSIPSTGPPRLAWEDYLTISSVIESLPSWPTDHDLAPDQWRDLARAALVFQRMNDTDFCTALIVYMTTSPDTPATHEDYYARQTKPLLLIRMMFDLEGVSRSDVDIPPGAGFSYRLTRTDTVESLDIPIHWVDGRPELVAMRTPLGGVSGEPQYLYQPHREYMQFISAGTLRSTDELDAVAGPPAIETWRDLATYFTLRDEAGE